MRFKILLYLVTCFLGLFGLSAQEKEVRTLTECIAIAVQNNPQLRQSELSRQRDDINLRQSKQNLLPNLNGNANHSINTGRNVDPTTNLFVEETASAGGLGLSSGLVLFDGLGMFHDIRMRSSARDAGRLEFEGAINQLKLDVITAYIQVLTMEDVLTQSEQQFEVTKERLRNAEVMHREGAFNPGDYHDIKGEYSANLNTIEQNRQNLNNTRLTLASLLNISAEQIAELERVDVPGQLEQQDAQELYRLAQENLPQYRAWEARIREAENGIKLAKSNYFPQLSLSAGINTYYSSLSQFGYGEQFNNNLGRGITFSLSVPIFSRFTIRNQVARSRLDLQDIKWQQEIALNNLRENTAKAVFDLDIAYKNIQNLQEQESSYAESFRVAQVQFDMGATNSVMYLTAKNKFENAQNQLIIKRYEWLLQKYINDFYAGTLDL